MLSSCCGLVLLAMLAAPGAQEAPDVWRGLRWDMPIDRAAQTLSRQGLKVPRQQPRKSASTWFSIDAGGLNATVYFDADGRMNQILVYHGKLTKEAVAAAKDRLTKRFGAVRDTTLRTRHTWGSWRTDSEGPWTTFRVVSLPEGWLAWEQHRRVKATGPAGVFDLTWGQTAPDVEQRLRATGFEAHTTAMLVDPCRMPNPPPGCEPDASVIVQFRKGDDEGTAEVHKKHGLVQITFEARVASHADGLARARSIEAVRGPALEIEDATITTWGDATANVSLDVRQTTPDGTLSAIEAYSPLGGASDPQ